MLCLCRCHMWGGSRSGCDRNHAGEDNSLWRGVCGWVLARISQILWQLCTHLRAARRHRSLVRRYSNMSARLWAWPFSLSHQRYDRLVWPIYHVSAVDCPFLDFSGSYANARYVRNNKRIVFSCPKEFYAKPGGDRFMDCLFNGSWVGQPLDCAGMSMTDCLISSWYGFIHGYCIGTLCDGIGDVCLQFKYSWRRLVWVDGMGHILCCGLHSCDIQAAEMRQSHTSQWR